jgi:hypothetical protein
MKAISSSSEFTQRFITSQFGSRDNLDASASKEARDGVVYAPYFQRNGKVEKRGYGDVHDFVGG